MNCIKRFFSFSRFFRTRNFFDSNYVCKYKTLFFICKKLPICSYVVLKLVYSDLIFSVYWSLMFILLCSFAVWINFTQYQNFKVTSLLKIVYASKVTYFFLLKIRIALVLFERLQIDGGSGVFVEF